ncbi:Crp/Fnr family transcriptional regulator [Sphingomonas bacterium]|uniref:Crp/Fnr family transcriptional regulator n=1 Tax=Sphingomonas bacterium TaxID=1895847 RepID=UPI0020C663CA|nr:Crp/Fnr family transcriptional regulator [Sphingomonas bacterium]
MAAIAALPRTKREIKAKSYLIREGDKSHAFCSLILSGMAYRHKLTDQGARQIVAIHVPDDLLDPQHLFLKFADYSVQALTTLEVADIDHSALQDLILQNPAVARALWVDGLVDSAIYREWVLNIGRRDARSRIAHLLCEMAVRMRAAGVIEDSRFYLPMTQEQMGDATGLTSVHVNRTLKALTASGLIEQTGRWIGISDWDSIRRVGDFNPLYLHLDQSAPQSEASLHSPFMT